MLQKPKLHALIEQHAILAYVIYTVIACLVIAAWTLWFAPKFKKLPDNFSYSADILSLDNFYDEVAQQFEGQHISKTTFSFDVDEIKPSYLIIRNSFKVRKLSDKPIFAVSRLYFIDPYSGAHVSVPGEEERQGYLFAPHYASKHPFTYWHINYNAPALMQFINTETINGLTVYHYVAHYGSDQTANLTRLPGVPDIRGVKTDVTLQLWIEPISGWLIKYQDNTLAYYYDRKTGKYLNPWNNFSNRYTQNSINEKVKQAVWLKRKFLFIDFGMPLLIVVTLMFIISYSTLKKYFCSRLLPTIRIYIQYKEAIYLGIAYTLFLSALAGSAYYIFWYHKQPSIYKIGISQWNNNAELNSAVQGFKDGLAEKGFQENKNIKFIIENPNSSIINQINIIQSFVYDNVDLIFTLTTPGTLVAKGVTNKIPIVFTDVSYPLESGIINPTQAGKTNLVGTLNYISPAEQFFQFDVSFPYTKTLGFVHHKGDPDSEIQYQEYKEMLSRRNIEVIDIPAIDFNDIKKQLAMHLQTYHYNSLFIACDTLMRDGGGNVAAEFSRLEKIPSFTCDQDSVKHGAMIGYFADLYAIGKLAGIKAAYILRGADPNWLQTDPPEHGYLLTNESTAQLLGLTIPKEELEQLNP